ncbi:GAF domain-containing protein [Streptomyces sp. Li-HN-5-11]|uniref:GAF domain-containing protein n=1 Tax=Streptomyces sp. Li-HN-5-11 TaxID=3075432 RepID=UPI0028A89D71|nr:GAF domain-containing protein [Streptomyces sp. Li-HN-5-11]WNM31944.1 GAF domain-containing protein [Streptomyces sp. Li-HN-5-11]
MSNAEGVAALVDLDLLERVTVVVDAAARGNVDTTLRSIVDVADSVISESLAATVVLVDGQVSSGLRLAACRGLSDRYQNAMISDPDQFRASAAARAIRSGRPVLVSDLLGDEDYRRWWHLARHEGYRSLLATPMMVGQAAIGSLNIYRRVVGELPRQEILLAEIFARVAASVLQTSLLLADRDNQVSALGRLVRALQDQAHEHSNRLQAIGGLLAIGELEGAKAFISDVSEAAASLRSAVTQRIAHATTSGLLVALSGVAAQQGIRVEVDHRSRFERPPANLSDSQLVTILGNLVDNAIAAVADEPEFRRHITVLVLDQDDQLLIEVSDGGTGLTMSLDEALEWGATSKSQHLGAGLALVNRIVASAMGVLDATHHADGTTFTVRIPVVKAGPLSP